MIERPNRTPFAEWRLRSRLRVVWLRLSTAYHCLRGRPTIAYVTLRGGGLVFREDENPRLRIVCVSIFDAPGHAIRFVPEAPR